MARTGTSHGKKFLSEKKSGAPGPIIIKKYANRRLYNTDTSSYITLEQLCDMVKEGVEFEVRDARTGDDITRQVLAQIIFEEENKGQHLLPIQFLRQLIRFYGDSLQAFIPSYLEMSMESFAKNQNDMRKKFADALGGKLGYRDFEQLTRKTCKCSTARCGCSHPSAQWARGTDPPMKARRGTWAVTSKKHSRLRSTKMKSRS